MPSASAREVIDGVFREAFAPEQQQPAAAAADHAAAQRAALQERLREAALRESSLRGELAETQRQRHAAIRERRTGAEFWAYSDSDYHGLTAKVKRLRHEAGEANRLRAQLREPAMLTPDQRQRIASLDAERWALSAETDALRRAVAKQRDEAERLSCEVAVDDENAQRGRNPIYHPLNEDRARAERHIQNAEARARAADSRLAELSKKTEEINAEAAKVRSENVTS